MGSIYCLYSTQDGEPRYIGQTDGDPVRRHKHHLTCALENEERTPLYDWIRTVLRSGHLVEMYVVQEDVTPKELLLFERYWFKQFSNLLNVIDNDFRVKSCSKVANAIKTSIQERLQRVE